MNKITKQDQRIGKQLGRHRTLAWLKVSQLARETQVSQRQWRKYESGENRIPVVKLHRFCELCGITVDQFLKDAKL